MEDNISNPLRFETNPYHNVIIKDRKVMELTGVKQIDSFDSSEFLLETAQGWMVIQGKLTGIKAGYRTRGCCNTRCH